MDFKMKPGVLSEHFEINEKDGWRCTISAFFIRAQCKRCGDEFEYSEKMISGEYIEAVETIHDLFTNATKGMCATCRIKTIETAKEECKHSYAFQGVCKRHNRISNDYRKCAEELSKVGTVRAATESMRYVFKYLENMDVGKLYRCVKCDGEKEQY